MIWALIGGFVLLAGFALWLAVRKAESGGKAEGKLEMVEEGREREGKAAQVLDGPKPSGLGLFAELRRKLHGPEDT